MKCDLVIISYNTRNLVHECIESALMTARNQIGRIVVVDNNSADDTVEFVSNKYPDVILVRNESNLGYSKAVNKGVERCSATLVLISNSDILFLPNAIANLSSLFELRKDIAVAGVRQVYPDKSWQYSYGFFPNRVNGLKDALLFSSLITTANKLKYNFFGKDSKMKEVDYADGGMLAVRKSAFDKACGFDEDYFFYSEDMDFCCKIKKLGHKVVFFPDAQVIHYRGGSSSSANVKYDSLKAILLSKIRFAEKHLPAEEFISYARSQMVKAKCISFSLFMMSIISTKAKSKKKYFDLTYQIWKEIRSNLVSKRD